MCIRDSGIPWLTSLSRASELDEIKAVEGILNGTTNYMLSAMTNSGADYAPALRKAQELGYAEADPTADVEGLDARRKIVLSADLAFGVNIREEDIPCVVISSITAGDIGAVLKLSGVNTGDTLCAPTRKVVLDGVSYPNPTLSMAIAPKTKGEEDKVAQGIFRLVEEDPTIKFVTNAETHQMVISGLGEQHLDVILSLIHI